MSANPVVGATQAAGHEAGWAAGQREGMAQGREEGYRNGFEAGREDGYLQGLKEGRADGQLEAQAMARLTVDDRLRHLDQLLAALPAEMIKRLHQSEDEMAALCFEVICRIVGDAVRIRTPCVAWFGAPCSWRARSLLRFMFTPPIWPVCKAMQS